jgi:DNA-binding NtrC family response regulator
MSENSQTIIVTSSGTDGAISAGLLFQKYGKDLPLFVTSQYAIGECLHSILEHFSPIKELYICGVGCHSNALELVQKCLKDLKKNNTAVIWVCGRGYLDSIQTELNRYCQTIFSPASSNSKVLAEQLLSEPNDQKIQEMLKLAEEFSTGDFAPENAQWHAFIENACQRYFKFNDIQAFRSAILKTAGLEKMKSSDLQDLDKYSYRPPPLGTSKAIRKVRDSIRMVAPTEEPVLILGPSGSGKELVARGVHEGSRRAKNTFLAINCAVLSTNADLAYDRLFGHAAGAYTGANKASKGAFVEASGGTLFLDEVAELPMSVQTQLLRVLEEKKVSPHGSVESKDVDVRIIAATNRDLPDMIRKGEFRHDLFYRLHVLIVKVPALKDRLEDLRSIAPYLLSGLKEQGYERTLTNQDWTAIKGYDWPGNIRQFANVLKRSVLMNIPLAETIEEEGELLASIEAPRSSGNIELLPSAQDKDKSRPLNAISLPASFHEAVPEAEIRRQYMRHVFELSGQKWAAAAQSLGVSSNTLRTWLE